MRIAIITGGTSGERDISIRSAESVARAVDFAETETFVFPEGQAGFEKRSREFDLAIPVMHGAGGEDGAVQSFFETLGVPYLFSGVRAHAAGIDKRASKELAERVGMPVAREISPDSPVFPLFAKPRAGGSSIASKVCGSATELDALMRDHPDLEFMLEEPLHGREFTVGIIESRGQPVALPVIEIIPKSGFFDFESKYHPEKLAQEICPARIPDRLRDQLQKFALDIHRAIGARHISRSDFILTESGPRFLEINTIPGMTGTSLVPKMLKEAGLSLSGLLQEWCSGK